MSLEEQIRSLAQQAANARWGHPGGPNGMYGDIPLKHVVQIAHDEWQVFYDEPDTLTEEYVDVERRGDILWARNWDDEIFEALIG